MANFSFYYIHIYKCFHSHSLFCYSFQAREVWVKVLDVCLTLNALLESHLLSVLRRGNTYISVPEF